MTTKSIIRMSGLCLLIAAASAFANEGDALEKRGLEVEQLPQIEAGDVAVFPQLSHRGAIKSVAFSPDGKQALSAYGNNLCLWDISSGREIRSFQGHTGWITSITQIICPKKNVLFVVDNMVKYTYNYTYDI
jgi:hypothetical protein